MRFEGETVWLTQKLMDDLFSTTPENILMHLKNIYRDGELIEGATTKDFLAVRLEGQRQVKRSLKHYNLDAFIIADLNGSSWAMDAQSLYVAASRAKHLLAICAHSDAKLFL